MDFRAAGLALMRWPVVWTLSGVAAGSVKGAEWAAAVTRRLPRFLWQPCPLVTARRRGLMFQLDLRDNVQRTLYFTGWYERRYLTWFIERLRRDDVFIDVGAHVGIHSLVAAKRLKELGGGRVVAFEPSNDLAAGLELAARRNGLANVTVVRAALGRGRGVAVLRSDGVRFHPADAAVRSFVGPGDLIEEVPVMAFDDWDSGFHRMDLVKIDVEGAELDVLVGMHNSVRAWGPRAIGVEMREYILKRAGVSAEDIVDCLNELGYVLLETDDMEGNFIFVPHEPAPSQRDK